MCTRLRSQSLFYNEWSKIKLNLFICWRARAINYLTEADSRRILMQKPLESGNSKSRTRFLLLGKMFIQLWIDLDSLQFCLSIFLHFAVAVDIVEVSIWSGL